MHRFNAGFGFAQPARLRSASGQNWDRCLSDLTLLQRSLCTAILVGCRWLSEAEDRRQDNTTTN